MAGDDIDQDCDGLDLPEEGGDDTGTNQDDTGGNADGQAGDDGGGDGGEEPGKGCGCTTAASKGASAGWLTLALGLLLLRRRGGRAA